MKQEEGIPNIEENNMEELLLDDEQFEKPTENIFGSSNASFLYSTDEAVSNLVEPSSFEEPISTLIPNTMIQEEADANDFGLSSSTEFDTVSMPTNSFTEMKDESIVGTPEVETILDEKEVTQNIESNKEAERETKSNLTFIFVFGILLLAITFLLPYISGYK